MKLFQCPVNVTDDSCREIVKMVTKEIKRIKVLFINLNIIDEKKLM